MDNSPSFHIDSARARRAFERIAAQYDASAVLQREVAQRMDERLSGIRHQPSMILDAGSGTGYGAALLHIRYPQATVCELDLAEGMLRVSREKQRQSASWLARLLPRKQPWQVCADMGRLPLADASVDMIWSNLALHWLTPPDSAFAEFRRVLKPGGLLMFSTLGPDTLQELRAAFAASDAPPAVHPFIDMHDLGDALLRAGLAEPVMDMEKIVLTYDDVAAVVRDVKAAGSHNAYDEKHAALMGKRRWQHICAAYEVWRDKAGRLPATYEIVYGHAWRGTEAARRTDGPQVINFVR